MNTKPIEPTNRGIIARAVALALSVGILATHQSPLLAVVVVVAGLHIGNILDISGE